MASTPAWALQSDDAIRCEWGHAGVAALAPHCDAIVIVDVLSFSTSVDLATSRGAVVFPYLFRDETAEAYAEEQGALLAGANDAGYSLRPATLTGIESGCRLVMPSPNGSTLSLAASGTPAVAGCLRNRSAVARWLAGNARTVGVVPAGERWPDDGGLRPAFEDWCGAGAVIDALPAGWSRSPEAQQAADAFRSTRDALATRIADCSSGREKRARGHEADLPLAAALDASDCVPVLRDGAYEAASSIASTRSG